MNLLALKKAEILFWVSNFDKNDIDIFHSNLKKRNINLKKNKRKSLAGAWSELNIDIENFETELKKLKEDSVHIIESKFI